MARDWLKKKKGTKVKIKIKGSATQVKNAIDTLSNGNDSNINQSASGYPKLSAAFKKVKNGKIMASKSS